MADEISLKTKNLTFGYDRDSVVIKDVSIAVASGKITALIGGNGCGKSTLFQLLAGRFKPRSGGVYLDGTNIKNIRQKDFAKKIAVVHQYNTAPPDMSVRKLVELGRTPYQNLFSYSHNEEDKIAVEKALEATNTKKFGERMFSQLSGGQKQRVWMAMALAQNPDILLLDEITTYLDVHYQIELLSLIKKLNKEQGITVLMVLHDINQAMEYSDEILVMKEGKMIGMGKTEDVITKEILENAFGVKTEILHLKKSKYCLFSAKEIE